MQKEKIPLKKTEFYGISYHKHRRAWRASIYWRGRAVYLGCYRDEELAAWVVDFARYLLYGLNPAAWHFNSGKPNGPPRLRDDYPRVLVLKRLANALPADSLRERLQKFDSLVR
jgi:hypothetical protein